MTTPKQPISLCQNAPKVLIALTLSLVCLLLESCGSGPAPDYPEEAKQRVVSLIKASSTSVCDAAIFQGTLADGYLIHLNVAVCNTSVSEPEGRHLGENFVRMVKLHGPEPNPGEQIGAGIYDYEIEVQCPTEEYGPVPIALGVKYAGATRIDWESLSASGKREQVGERSLIWLGILSAAYKVGELLAEVFLFLMFALAFGALWGLWHGSKWIWGRLRGESDS